MGVGFEHMTEFLVLAETLSYFEAAEKLYISQASLSRHIKALEEALGVQLFDRSTRSVKLTSSGVVLLPYARKTAALWKECNAALAKHQTALGNTINIGILSNRYKNKILDILNAFTGEHPGIRINLNVDNTSRLYARLESRICNIVFVTEKDGEQTKNIRRIPYARQRLKAYVSSSSPFASKKSISIEELKDENFILSEENSIAYKMLMDACEKAGFTPFYAYNGMQPDDIGFPLRNGGGVALAFDSTSLKWEGGGITQIEVQPEIVSYVNMLYVENRLNPMEKEFVRFFRENYALK